MFGINEWELAGGICITVFVAWIVVLIGFEIWSHVWAWVDESKPARNWLMKWSSSKSEWKYPVYYSSISDLMGYAKDKKLDGVKNSDLKEGVDYISEYKKGNAESSRIAHWMAFTSILPLAALIGLKLYPVTVAVVTLVLIAHLSRFTRRLNKKYKGHAGDKSIHIQPKETK